MQKRFAWVEEWGCLIWLMVIVAVLLTAGAWAACIIGWHFGDILNPKYVCQHCGRKIKNEQLRS
jgi:uncharacterized membrane protein|tara:strand:+ start:189 stop:380 length:192 start_codon:yes stop_codon:yes gene_type:complete